jgi:hypothetical protein
VSFFYTPWFGSDFVSYIASCIENIVENIFSATYGNIPEARLSITKFLPLQKNNMAHFGRGKPHYPALLFFAMQQKYSDDSRKGADIRL